MIPKIEWRSKQERLDCFDALLVLGRRGCIRFSAFHETMEIVMGRSVWTHELAKSEHLRAQLEGREEWLGPIGSFQQVVKDGPEEG